MKILAIWLVLALHDQTKMMNLAKPNRRRIAHKTNIPLRENKRALLADGR
jgi:hypothetical protein